MPHNYKIIDSLELFQVTELEVSLVELPSGEQVIIFTDQTGESPIIYKWCFDMASSWVQSKLGINIFSYAHDWKAMLPVSDDLIVCSRCGVITHIGQWDIKLCTEHVEGKTSGF